MHPSVIFFVILVIASSQQICTCNPIAIAQTSIKLAVTLFDAIKKVSGSTEDEKPNDKIIYNKLNQLSTDFQDLRDSIMDKITKTLKDKLTEKSDELFKYMKDVQRLYKQFIHYYHDSDKYESTELQDFANVATTASLVELPATIEKMHESLVDLDIKQESLVSIIAKDSTPPDTMCIRGQSAQQLISELYEAVALTDTKGLMITLYSLNLKAHFENRTYAFRQNREMQNYKERILSTSNKVLKSMNIASREIWKCDSAHQKLGTSYSKLQEVFQGYYVYQTDTTRNRWYAFFYSCASMVDERLRCRTPVCKAQPSNRRCTGHLRDCQSIANKMQVCHSHEGSDRRYDWMKTYWDSDSSELYGREEGACRQTQGLYRVLNIDTCFCNCESEGREIDRYFSVKSVISDIDQNKVITGLRIVKNNHVFHIQIQQGKLGSNGTIIDKLEWKEISPISSSELLSDKVSTYHYVIHSYPQDNDDHELKYSEWVEFYKNDIVYPVSYDRKTVYLDDLEAPQGQLLTGIRFQFVSDDMRLEIQTTPFEYATGQLKKDASKWIFNPNTYANRKEVVLTEPDDPIRLGASDIFTRSNNYVKFRLSDLRRDMSQYTVPFIDTQEVVPTTPLPLSGAGIFHKGRKFSGGFLAMKIMHYDFARYL